MTVPSEFVVWVPSDGGEPQRLTADNSREAAKLFVLREQAGGCRHENTWSASQVLVVDYETGASVWWVVKVTVESNQS